MHDGLPPDYTYFAFFYTCGSGDPRSPISEFGCGLDRLGTFARVVNDYEGWLFGTGRIGGRKASTAEIEPLRLLPIAQTIEGALVIAATK